MKESAIEILKQRMISKNTLLCCGLDPDLSKLPHDYSLSNLKDDERIIEFLRQIVDITSKYVCAYKIQKAFFDKFPFGHNHLKEIIAYIHKNHAGIPIILDCKIGDIDNTMKVYLDNIFGNLQADGVVVNPYMGDDVMVPLAQYPDKAIVVLVKTSNPGGKIVQDVELKEGHPLWQHILQLTVGRWNSANNMIPVVSSTVGLNMKNIREMIPDNMPILLAGVGAQGDLIQI